MGIFDYIKGAAYMVTTRSGREELLGFSVYEKDRELRRRALEDFEKNYPEFNYYGHCSEFDGYVQYKKGAIFYCGLFERSSELKEHFNKLREEKDVEEIDYKLIAGNEIPRIKILLSTFKDWREHTKIYSTSFKVNYAYIWFSGLKDDIQLLRSMDQLTEKTQDSDEIFVESTIHIDTHPLKKKAFEQILYLIKDGSIPFESTSEISKLDKYQQLLVLADALHRMKAEPFLEGLPWLPVFDSDYLCIKNGDSWEEENSFWRRVFLNTYSKDFNIEDAKFDISFLVAR